MDDVTRTRHVSWQKESYVVQLHKLNKRWIRQILGKGENIVYVRMAFRFYSLRTKKKQDPQTQQLTI
jgi:hypothetical protein